jgi:hypothetical protein
MASEDAETRTEVVDEKPPVSNCVQAGTYQTSPYLASMLRFIPCNPLAHY